MFEGAILGYVIVAVIGFIVGVFVYRNNTSLISPIAEKIDAKFDELEAKLEVKIQEVKEKIEEKTNI